MSSVLPCWPRRSSAGPVGHRVAGVAGAAARLVGPGHARRGGVGVEVARQDEWPAGLLREKSLPTCAMLPWQSWHTHARLAHGTAQALGALARVALVAGLLQRSSGAPSVGMMRCRIGVGASAGTAAVRCRSGWPWWLCITRDMVLLLPCCVGRVIVGSDLCQVECRRVVAGLADHGLNGAAGRWWEVLRLPVISVVACFASVGRRRMFCPPPTRH